MTDGVNSMAAVFALQRGDEAAAAAIAAAAGLDLGHVHELQRRMHDTALREREVAANELFEASGSRLLSEVDGAPPPPLINDRIDPEGPTIIFGPGDVGKGVEAARLIAVLTNQGERVLISDYEGHDGEWRRRVAGHGGDVSLVRIVQPADPAWQLTKGAIWNQAEELRAIREAHGAKFHFVDSIVAATAGSRDPYSPEVPSNYGKALQIIGGLTTSLAHVNRSDDMRYPFGSVFWHNFARTTWSMDREGDRVRITHRKLGNRESMGAFQIDFQFDDAAGTIATVIQPWTTTAGMDRQAMADEQLDAIPSDGDGMTLSDLRRA